MNLEKKYSESKKFNFFKTKHKNLRQTGYSKHKKNKRKTKFTSILPIFSVIVIPVYLILVSRLVNTKTVPVYLTCKYKDPFFFGGPRGYVMDH